MGNNTVDFKVVFHPARGERYSPRDYIIQYFNTTDRSNLQDRFEKLARTNPMNWSEVVEIKLISKNLYQLTVGDFRVYLGLDNAKEQIVVSYICRKVTTKAKNQDLRRAKESLDKYFRREKDNNER